MLWNARGIWSSTIRTISALLTWQNTLQLQIQLAESTVLSFSCCSKLSLFSTLSGLLCRQISSKTTWESLICQTNTLPFLCRFSFSRRPIYLLFSFIRRWLGSRLPILTINPRFWMNIRWGAASTEIHTKFCVIRKSLENVWRTNGIPRNFVNSMKMGRVLISLRKTFFD